GGVSIGGIMARPEVAASLAPGTHASTFGGNPLACVAAIATIEAIEEENMLDNTLNMGRYIREKFSELQNQYSIIDGVSGLGLMIGIQLNEPGADIVNKCWEKGLRINCTQNTVLRFMPALNVTQAEIDQAIKILSDVMTEMNV
ncbi:MAG: aminotransferase class III-fold pyridoxal phosphate-dependent enzyme, partial [Sedimentisphaerales bacterium]|nr:aminotransferase class III-fold pyridoxal phosphate-dependent enzyme [Sedimentisphaerales bacterium]